MQDINKKKREGVEAIDWAQPWLRPYGAWGQIAAKAIAGGASVAQALNECANQSNFSAVAGPLRFVEPDAMPLGEAYESFIARAACIPTRDNLHDFFNGLVWLAWPALKRRLHEIQAGQIAALGVSGQRGPVRDAITLFDENGALLSGPPALTHALAARDWHSLFVGGRGAWRDTRIVIVGHALLEQLVHPRKPLCAHVWCRDGAWVGADAQRATWHGDITAADLQPKPFCPLPVLGVPGWWPANESTDFYADVSVFRAARVGQGG